MLFQADQNARHLICQVRLEGRSEQRSGGKEIGRTLRDFTAHPRQVQYRHPKLGKHRAAFFGNPKVRCSDTAPFAAVGLPCDVRCSGVSETRLSAKDMESSALPDHNIPCPPPDLIAVPLTVRIPLVDHEDGSQRERVDRCQLMFGRTLPTVSENDHIQPPHLLLAGRIPHTFH